MRGKNPLLALSSSSIPPGSAFSPLVVEEEEAPLLPPLPLTAAAAIDLIRLN